MIAKRIPLTSLLIVSALGLALASCGLLKPAATEAPRKVATFFFTQEFDTLAPFYTPMWFSSATLQLWNCAGWVFDENNAPRPDLVAELPSEANGGLSADGKVITLKLRRDIFWSDGEPITSQDFVFTYEMVTNPKNMVVSTYPFDQYVSVEAPDPSTVVITFAQPFAPWSSGLWGAILPAHVLRPVFERDGTLDIAVWNNTPTVGCGPYVFSEWETGSFARFVANPVYWGPKPKIDEVFIRFVPDAPSLVAGLKAGDADLGLFVELSDIPDLKQAGLTVLRGYSGFNEGWFFILGGENPHPALQDIRVRQAIALALDRFSVAHDLLLGETKVPATFYEDTPWTDPAVKPWPYDPKRAGELLDEAGWVDTNGDGVRDKDGVELVLKHGTTIRKMRQDLQLVAQEQLAEVGIRLELSSYDEGVFFAGPDEDGPFATGQIDIAEFSLGAFPDPDTPFWLCDQIPTDESPLGLNWQRLCDPELDALYRQQATQVDLAQRQKTLQEISRLITEKVYWLGIWQDTDLWAVGPRLKNVKISGITPFFSLTEWDLTP